MYGAEWQRAGFKKLNYLEETAYMLPAAEAANYHEIPAGSVEENG